MGNLPAGATEASLKQLFDSFAGSEVPFQASPFCLLPTTVKPKF